MGLVDVTDWREITLGNVFEFLFSGSRLEELSAWVAISGSAASLVGGIVAVIIAAQSFRLSKQTNALQEEAARQRNDIQREQQIQFETQKRWAEQAQAEARKWMQRSHAESEQHRARISAEHAWFEIVPHDVLGQKWRVINVGANNASQISIEDDSSGNAGVWNLEGTELFDLEAGKEQVFTFFPHVQREISALLKVSWSEFPEGYYDYDFDAPDPNSETTEPEPEADEEEVFEHTQHILIEFLFGVPDDQTPFQGPHFGVTGYPLPL